MSLAYFHLVSNHIPIIGIPFSLLVLAYGYRTRNVGTQKVGLFMICAISLISLPVFFTGEPAEELVEHLAGFNTAAIESHEDAATVALVLTLLCGVVSAGALWRLRYSDFRWVKLSLVAAVIATASLFYTANLGGAIRHTEMHP